ncbi:chemotaxis protein CheD, partial [Pseudomonas syringae pv. tagetis]
VAITFSHPWRRIGGICHFMMPGRIRKHQPQDGKYGDEAMEMLIRQALASGTMPEENQVKLFGGGEMIPPQRQQKQMQN